jgi:hypothetical protein
MLFKIIECAVARRHSQKSRDEVKAEVMADHEEVGRVIARRYARGNVNIQNGAFLTQKDLDAKHKELSGV